MGGWDFSWDVPFSHKESDVALWTSTCSCTQQSTGEPAYWFVKFADGNLHHVAKIRLWNREDGVQARLNNACVRFTENDTMPLNNNTNCELSSSDSGPGSGTEVLIDKPITGMMLISNEPTVDVDIQTMTICGIEIYLRGTADARPLLPSCSRTVVGAGTKKSRQQQRWAPDSCVPEQLQRRCLLSVDTLILGEVLGKRSLSLLVLKLLLLLQFTIGFWVLARKQYTEIDWTAYMEQVALVRFGGGEEGVGGPPGPMKTGDVLDPKIEVVEPSKNRAQPVWLVLLVANLGLMGWVSVRYLNVPVLFFLPVVFSKRLYSLTVLRLFNDLLAMLFGHVALLCFARMSGEGDRDSDAFRYVRNRDRRSPWPLILGCFFYSVAVSVKMNLLLMAPGLAYYLFLYRVRRSVSRESSVYARVGGAAVGKLLWRLRMQEAGQLMGLMAGVQCVLGWPFLRENPRAYIHRSFDLGRVFLYKWTVNWRFVPEAVFLSKPWALLLLLATFLGWGLEHSAQKNTLPTDGRHLASYPGTSDVLRNIALGAVPKYCHQWLPRKDATFQVSTDYYSEKERVHAVDSTRKDLVALNQLETYNRGGNVHPGGSARDGRAK
eukprot:g12437.t1